MLSLFLFKLGDYHFAVAMMILMTETWDFLVGSWSSINEWCLIAWVSFTAAIFPWFPLALSADLLDIVNVTFDQSCLWWSAEDDWVEGECGGVVGEEAGGGEGGGGEGAHLLLGQTPRRPHDQVGFTTAHNLLLNWTLNHFIGPLPCQFTHTYFLRLYWCDPGKGKWQHTQGCWRHYCFYVDVSDSLTTVCQLLEESLTLVCLLMTDFILVLALNLGPVVPLENTQFTQYD